MVMKTNHHRFLLVTVVTVTAVVLQLMLLEKTQLVSGLASPSSSPSSSSLSLSSPLSTALDVTVGVDPVIDIDIDIASGNSNCDAKNANKNNNELESQVIVSIQNVASSASNITEDPKHFFSTLGTFGKSSGALIGQKWLTPESLEECTLFWDDGFRVLMRDLFRSYLFSQQSTRYKVSDWVALGWFLLLASSSSIIFFPLLLPLIRVGLQDVGENGIDEATYLPPSFRNPRLAAMRRLRRPTEEPLGKYLNNGTPRNVQEGISFFKDGTLLLARDLTRGTLTARPDDTWKSYGWFAFLAFSSFPITPLILPLIDKRRNGEHDATSDYVPSSYRPERLKALARLRDIEAVKFGTSPIDTLRAAANTNADDRPPPERLLQAMVEAQTKGIASDKSVFLEQLAGGPGRKWELAYIAGKPALMAMRKQLGASESQDKSSSSSSSRNSNENENSGSNSESWYRPLERLLLPWTRLRDGLYIDSNLVSAVQNFDVETMQNKNGVFSILGSDFFQTTVEGPFSWDGDCDCRISIQNDNNEDNNDGQPADNGTSDSKRRTKNAAICAFRPTTATFRLGPWWTIDQDIPEEAPFDQTHIRDLPFFKFIHVDDTVAVAMGRSGSVALWTRMPEP